ncbi:hypothetical protein HDU82_003447 [Entophlyctis luteolus]|nr:hypothetical protein HDU82_003447 [Entophlyctis luteolus]
MQHLRPKYGLSALLLTFISASLCLQQAIAGDFVDMAEDAGAPATAQNTSGSRFSISSYGNAGSQQQYASLESWDWSRLFFQAFGIGAASFVLQAVRLGACWQCAPLLHRGWWPDAEEAQTSRGSAERGAHRCRWFAHLFLMMVDVLLGICECALITAVIIHIKSEAAIPFIYFGEGLVRACLASVFSCASLILLCTDSFLHVSSVRLVNSKHKALRSEPLDHEDVAIVALFCSLIVFINASSVAFMKVEGWGFREAEQWCIASISTLGFAGVSVETDTGKILLLFTSAKLVCVIRRMLLRGIRKMRKKVKLQKKRLQARRQRKLARASANFRMSERSGAADLPSWTSSMTWHGSSDATQKLLGKFNFSRTLNVSEAPGSACEIPRRKSESALNRLFDVPASDHAGTAAELRHSSPALRVSQTSRIRELAPKKEEPVEEGKEYDFALPLDRTDTIDSTTAAAMTLGYSLDLANAGDGDGELQKVSEEFSGESSEKRPSQIGAKLVKCVSRLSSNLGKQISENQECSDVDESIPETRRNSKTGTRTVEEKAAASDTLKNEKGCYKKLYIFLDSHSDAVSVMFSIFVALFGGAGLFWVFENGSWTYLDALYFNFSLITTTGYGDIYPRSGWGRTFVIVMIFLGLGLWTYFVSALIARVQAGRVSIVAKKIRDKGLWNRRV